MKNLNRYLSALLAVLLVSTSTFGAFIPNRDFLIEVAKGNVPGHALVHKFGRNDSVPNGTWAHINLLGSGAWQLTTATAIRIKAGGDAADTAAGAGAREITCDGLDGTGAEEQGVMATAGASASSATAETFIRVFRCWVSAVGTYGVANTAAITIENGAGGTDLIQIGADEGQTQFAAYTCPLARTCYLVTVDATVDAAKAADFKMLQLGDILDTTAPMAAKRIKHYWDGVLGAVEHKPNSPESAIPALTDIWMEANGGGAGTEASAEFELLVVDN